MCVCVYIPHHLHSSIDGHLGSFHSLAVVDNAINIGMHVSVFELVFSFSFVKYPVVELLDLTVIFNFLRTLETSPRRSSG